jgi:hypothetical protein
VKEAVAGNPALTAGGFLFKERYRDPAQRQELRRRQERAGFS